MDETRQRSASTEAPEEPQALLLASRFRVTIGGEEIGVCRVEGLAMTEGADSNVVRIERALSPSRTFFDWRAEAQRSEAAVRDVLVEQLDARGSAAVVGFRLVKARPIAWHAPRWDALDGGIAIEALELAYDALQWESPAGGAS